MQVLHYVFIAVVGVISGVLSGISGGGGGMIMIPAFILVGLPPQQAVATGKMNGLGATFGGLSVFAKKGHFRKDILRVMIPIAIVIGLITPLIFSTIKSSIFQLVLGLIMILLVPTLFINKQTLSPPSKKHKIAGYSAYSGVLTLQAIFGTGVGSLALFVLTLLFGTSKIEANATKRAVTAFLTPITFVALLISGYVNLRFGIVGLVSVFIGTHYGSKLALKKSDRYITLAMAVIISLSGVALVVSALE